MTLSEIIEQTRWCIDEESSSRAEIFGATMDDERLDNIIKAKISDAMIFCLANCSADKLSGDNELIQTGPDVIQTVTLTDGQTVATLKEDVMRIIRVRLTGWKRSVAVLTEEFSDTYLQQADLIAKATNENPVVAIIRSSPMKLEFYPSNNVSSIDNVQISAIMTPSGDDYNEDDNNEEIDIHVPKKLRTAFFYYLAFLVLSAFHDPWGKQMYEIAVMNLKNINENAKS